MLRELNLNEMEAVSGGQDIIVDPKNGQRDSGLDWEQLHDFLDLNNNGSIVEETSLAVVVGAPLAAGAAVVLGASAGVATLVGTATGIVIGGLGFFTGVANGLSGGSSSGSIAYGGSGGGGAAISSGQPSDCTYSEDDEGVTVTCTV